MRDTQDQRMISGAIFSRIKQLKLYTPVAAKSQCSVSLHPLLVE
jgi:hypothetical protein